MKSVNNVRLERAVSGRFGPLPAPFPLRYLSLRSRSIVFLPRPLFTSRSAPPDFRPAPLTCSGHGHASHARLLTAQPTVSSTREATQQVKTRI